MKSLQDLIEPARANAPGLAEMMTRHLPGLQFGGAAAVPATDTVPMRDTTTVGTIASGNVVAVWGQDFLFAAASDKPATISIDRQAQLAMTRVPGTNYWFRLETLPIGATHKTRGYDFHFRFVTATHSSAQGAMDLPESLSWLGVVTILRRRPRFANRKKPSAPSRSVKCRSPIAMPGE